MAVTPNKKFTLVLSATNNSITVVNNAQEAAAQSSPIPLPASTESMFVWIDSLTAYAAVPNAPVTGQPPGAVEVLNLSQNIISATLPVPGAHYIVQSHNGNRILAFGDNPQNATPQCVIPQCITIISPSLIGTSTDPRTSISSPAFDHPVWGVFSADDSTAYILNCGPECGGTAASITVLDMATNTPATTIPLVNRGATIGLLSGNMLYVAGTPPSACVSGSQGLCGVLSVVDVSSMTVTNANSPITDGYHNRMEISASGQLFIGAHTCTASCLSIFNTASSNVVISPDTGDVTGMEPILNRSVVYVVENGELRIYDTTTDKLQKTGIDIIGQAIDVKLVDF
jgi:hypothetical protein